MLLRKRCRLLLCPLHVAVIMFGLLLVMVILAILNPEAQSEDKPQDERVEESNHFKVQLLSHLSSLKEEELIAMGMSSPERNFDKVPRKMYRIVKQLKQKNEEASPSPELCLQQNYGEKLPTASVIISFHNEAWSTPLRIVHSVLDHSPRTFLKEIVLVDDLSHQEHLKSALSEYISRIGGVKMIRSNKRLGVTGGRMLGAAKATGEVFIFMDSHCECHPGWLEPLLSRIMHNRNRIVSPVIDSVDWKTFEDYHSSLPLQVFDWKLDFHWVPLPEHEKKGHQSPIIPFRSPVIPGYVVATDRHYFQNIGGFDAAVNFLGVETTELSIRVIEIVLCSHVGHVYQNHTMYNSVQNEAILRSKVRTAELWMDSYKATFYRTIGNTLLMSRINESDIKQHEQLHQRLGCKRFQCFLDNLYNAGVGLCITHTLKERLFVIPVELASCDENGNQVFEYNSIKEIRFISVPFCLTVKHEQVSLENCTTSKPAASQMWHFSHFSFLLYLNPCSHQRNQIWKLLPVVYKASG
ncbi:hypothetical protein XELAEV_18033099mg [Xenopus laevis]|uniref:Polypeptide N-acetylgalactosaminyltransferase n=1 Tax=Xenopus laevis TaxID=8355 RepID=A0A974HDP1_XENLA|nr:hypothetical protein XELAEV_18033099mg [Xenopus laevis]